MLLKLCIPVTDYSSCVDIFAFSDISKLNHLLKKCSHVSFIVRITNYIGKKTIKQFQKLKPCLQIYKLHSTYNMYYVTPVSFKNVNVLQNNV